MQGFAVICLRCMVLIFERINLAVLKRRVFVTSSDFPQTYSLRKNLSVSIAENTRHFKGSRNHRTFLHRLRHQSTSGESPKISPPRHRPPINHPPKQTSPQINQPLPPAPLITLFIPRRPIDLRTRGSGRQRGCETNGETTATERPYRPASILKRASRRPSRRSRGPGYTKTVSGVWEGEFREKVAEVLSSANVTETGIFTLIVNALTIRYDGSLYKEKLPLIGRFSSKIRVFGKMSI